MPLVNGIVVRSQLEEILIFFATSAPLFSLLRSP